MLCASRLRSITAVRGCSHCCDRQPARAIARDHDCGALQGLLCGRQPAHSIMSLAHCTLAKECAFCVVAHALSTEKQEVMGLLFGRWDGPQAFIEEAHPLARTDRRADRGGGGDGESGHDSG